MRVSSPLMKNVLTLLVKSVLIPLGLTAAASTTYALDIWIGYGCTYNLKRTNERYHENR